MILRRSNGPARVRQAGLVGVFFLLSISAGVGLITVTTSWASGVTMTDETQMMTNDAASYPLAFDTAIQTAVTELQSTGQSQPATNFYASYTTTTQDYGTALLSAANLYAQNASSDPAGAKNAFIDNFGHARAVYFNELEAARNTVISETSGNDVARNMFVNEYNSARDTYNNQLEMIKNQIASLN